MEESSMNTRLSGTIDPRRNKPERVGRGELKKNHNVHERGHCDRSEIAPHRIFVNSLPDQPHIVLGPVGINHLNYYQQNSNAANSLAINGTNSNSISDNKISAVGTASNQSNPKPLNRSNDAASLFIMNGNSHANGLVGKQHLVVQQGPTLTVNNGQSSAATHSNGGDNIPWLQHMILNQISPLQNNLINFNSNTVMTASGNVSNEFGNNQANVNNTHQDEQPPNQQRLAIENSHGATTNFFQQQQQQHQQQQQQQQQQPQPQPQPQQGSTPLCGGTTPAAPNVFLTDYKRQFGHLLNNDTAHPEQQQFTNIQGQQQQQQQQQQQPQNFQQPQPKDQQGAMYLNELQQQLLVANKLASSQIQMMPPAQRGQQQATAVTSSIGNHQTQTVTTTSTLPTTTSLPSGAGMITPTALQQQQNQLLLLALIFQQQSNNNNGGAANVDLNALSATLATPEGIRLLNSFGIGQPVTPLQQPQQSQQLLSVQQQNYHRPQQQNVSTALPSNQFDIEILTPVATTATQGPQKGAASKNQHLALFINQQSQQQSQPMHSFQSATPLPLPMPMVQPQTMPEQQKENGTGIRGSTGIIPAAEAAINQHFSVPAASARHTAITTTTQAPVTSGSGISNTMASLLAANSTNTTAGGRNTVSRSMQQLLEKEDSVSSIEYSIVSGSNGNAGNCLEKPTKVAFPRILYTESDDGILGEYQSLLRQQLELFEADGQDVINGTFRQGRTTPITLGQIGLRCRHCAMAPMSVRTKGSVYFSQTVKGMYQIAQNMSKVHLCERCARLPKGIKKKLVTLRSRKNRASGGRAYWIRHLREIGIYEDGKVLRARPPRIMKKSPPSTTMETKPAAGPPPPRNAAV